MDAVPRLALCLADCTDGQEQADPDEVCLVCWSLSRPAKLIGCEFCRSKEWKEWAASVDWAAL